MGRVIIGVDPHKLSATIEFLDEREKVCGGGRFGTDGDGYRQMLLPEPAMPHISVGRTGRSRGR